MPRLLQLLLLGCAALTLAYHLPPDKSSGGLLLGSGNLDQVRHQQLFLGRVHAACGTI